MAWSTLKIHPNWLRCYQVVSITKLRSIHENVVLLPGRFYHQIKMNIRECSEDSTEAFQVLRTKTWRPCHTKTEKIKNKTTLNLLREDLLLEV